MGRTRTEPSHGIRIVLPRGKGPGVVGWQQPGAVSSLPGVGTSTCPRRASGSGALQGDAGKDTVAMRQPLFDNFSSSSHLGKNVSEVICTKEAQSRCKVLPHAGPRAGTHCRAQSGAERSPCRPAAALGTLLLHLLLFKLPGTEGSVPPSTGHPAQNRAPGGLPACSPRGRHRRARAAPPPSGAWRLGPTWLMSLVQAAFSCLDDATRMTVKDEASFGSTTILKSRWSMSCPDAFALE